MVQCSPLANSGDRLQRLHIHLQGMLQGVGFRPFVYGLATDLALTGWVKNTEQGVEIEVEGSTLRVAEFLERLDRDKPPFSFIQTFERQSLQPIGETTFEIHLSAPAHSNPAPSSKTALILPDLATCPQCLREIRDRHNRRYRYPFTNCTHCGPRFSIIQELPYDRPHTTMRQFQMCPDCEREYRDPRDRRFHAQPNACPRCGPHLELWDRQGMVLGSDRPAASADSTTPDCLTLAANALRAGKILAVKGMGGFHLMVDARNAAAVQTLRDRKQRPDKPLALMYPSLEAIRQDCEVSDREAQWLQSAEAPIVLVRKRLGACHSAPCEEIAPQNPNLGVMLPYTPLHHLLLAELGFPLVATSGNLAGEPICTDELEALKRLGAIADLFLVHNRPIARPVDDSIVRVMADEVTVLRRGRGYAPMPIQRLGGSPTQVSSHQSLILAVGAHLKNTVALAVNGQILGSQHIGDLDSPQAIARCQDAIAQLCGIYAVKLDAIACDAHPDYSSTQIAHIMATTQSAPVIPVQHHYAHVLSCIAEQRIHEDCCLEPPVLGIAWDGTGYGLDGTIWGGEFLYIPREFCNPGFERMAHLGMFRLPGGDRAAREPRRSALGLLYECFGEAALNQTDLPTLQAFTGEALRVLKTMLQRGVNAPQTSSTGRLFDAVASLLGLCQTATYEGQAALRLEAAIASLQTDEHYPYQLIRTPQTLILDWKPMLAALLRDRQQGVETALISARFHNTLVEGMVAIARQSCAHLQTAPHRLPVALTGGCFQNRYLLERAIAQLRAAGFPVYWHHQVPPNDGGIAIGQIAAAQRQLSIF